MNYAKMRKMDISNAPGVRATLFTSGCTHNCKGCFQPETWNFNYGKKFDKATEEEFMSYLKNPNIVGVNVLGGDPLQQTMDNTLVNLLHRIKVETNLNIWMWTGYTWEEAIKDADRKNILQYVDVLVDGKFEENNKDLMLKYRGSSNQRVIDVQESLKTCKVVHYNE